MSNRRSIILLIAFLPLVAWLLAYFMEPKPKFDPLTVNRKYRERYLTRGGVPDQYLEDKGEYYRFILIPSGDVPRGNIRLAVKAKELLYEDSYETKTYTENGPSKSWGSSKSSSSRKISLPADIVSRKISAFYSAGQVTVIIPKRNGWEIIIGPFDEIIFGRKERCLELPDSGSPADLKEETLIKSRGSDFRMRTDLRERL